MALLPSLSPQRLALLRQYFVAFIACFSVLSAGSAYTWIEPLMNRLTKPGSHLLLTEAQISWIASLIEIGPLITPLPAGFLVNRLGRKRVLLMSGPWYILTWVIILSTRSYPVLLTVRILQGMGIGVIMTTLPLYLGEIASPSVRGSVGTFVQCMWYLGVIYVYSIGPFVSYMALTVVCLVPPLIFTVIFFWFPESPYCLVMQEKEKAAQKSLSWFRGGECNEQEMKDIKDSVEEEKRNSSTWKDLVLSKVGRRAMTIALVVGLTTYMSGLRTVQAYASATFSATTGDHFSADLVTIAMGVLTLVATAFSSLLVDRWGRRPLLLFSAVGSTVVLSLAALFFFLEFHSRVDVSSVRFTPYVTITLYSILMSLSSSIGFTLQAELFPNSTRGIASGATTLSTTVMCFCSLKLYHVFQDQLGLYFNYLIFALFAAVGSIIIYKITPETKGKTFSEIQKMLGT